MRFQKLTVLLYLPLLSLGVTCNSISSRSYLGNIIRSLAMFQVQRNRLKTSKRKAKLKLLFFDLSKAFDTIDHRIKFPIGKSALND